MNTPFCHSIDLHQFEGLENHKRRIFIHIFFYLRDCKQNKQSFVNYDIIYWQEWPQLIYIFMYTFQFIQFSFKVKRIYNVSKCDVD